jgi:two-component system KDP operon response regulator KdpE
VSGAWPGATPRFPRTAQDQPFSELDVLGGATRILIIDDDPHPVPPQARCGGSETEIVGGLLSNGTATGTAAPGDATLSDSAERPLVHEYQMAAPVPLRPEPNEAAAAESEGTASNVSVVRELIARVEELLHRARRLPAGASSGWTGTIRFGSVLVEPATQTVLRSGQPLRVTHTEFRLLLALMRRRGAIASRLELLREVWGAGAAVGPRAVDTHIARLRRKLEEDPANPRHILTALAWGYRFRP